MSSVFHGMVVKMSSWAHKDTYIPLARTEQFTVQIYTNFCRSFSDRKSSKLS